MDKQVSEKNSLCEHILCITTGNIIFSFKLKTKVQSNERSRTKLRKRRDGKTKKLVKTVPEYQFSPANWKNCNDLAYSCPTDYRIHSPLKAVEHHSTMVSRGLGVSIIGLSERRESLRQRRYIFTSPVIRDVFELFSSIRAN